MNRFIEMDKDKVQSLIDRPFAILKVRVKKKNRQWVEAAKNFICKTIIESRPVKFDLSIKGLSEAQKGIQNLLIEVLSVLPMWGGVCKCEENQFPHDDNNVTLIYRKEIEEICFKCGGTSSTITRS
ncbi:hypothetical protein LCGC14_3039860 [marine sediment metagenome]|uniref:Uncharacterized protein n=1 Tax=marine sediment metagenome TaxID=412755 RepID=A0A0F8ZFX8_9ZZZZ